MSTGSEEDEVDRWEERQIQREWLFQYAPGSHGDQLMNFLSHLACHIGDFKKVFELH